MPPLLEILFQEQDATLLPHAHGAAYADVPINDTARPSRSAQNLRN